MSDPVGEATAPAPGGPPAVTVTRRIEFSDVDPSGRYHYSTAVRLFEAAEVELLDRLDLLDEVYESMPRAHVELDYRRTLWFRDEVESTVSVLEVGRSSVTFGFELTRDGELCAEGRLVAVHVDERGEPHPWSEEHRRRLEGRG